MEAADLTGIHNAQKRPAGSKSQECNADYHKGKVIELADGKDAGEQDFKNKRRKSDEKNGNRDHRLSR